MDSNYSSKFNELLARQFSERLSAVKDLPLEQRTYMLTDMLSKEASALQHIMDAYPELTDEILEKMIHSIETRTAKNDNAFSSGFFNVRKGDA